MAENVEKKLNQDFIRCTICKEIYKEPKMLPCLHSFCLHCLKQWVTNHKSHPLACPTCGCTVDLPSKDVHSLPQNFFLISLIERSEEVRRLSTQNKDQDCNICRNEVGTTFCLDCKVHFCPDCKGTHERLTRSSDHLVISSDKVSHENCLEKVISSQAPYCHSHKQEKVNYYCTQCHQLACQRCAIVLYQGYLDVQEVESRASSVRNIFETLLTKNKAQSGEVSDKLRQTKITTETAKREASDLLSQIDACYDKIIAKLESDKEKLRNEIQQIKESKCTKLGDMELKISTCLKAFENAQEMIHTILEQSNPWDILKMETNIAKSCESLQAYKDRVFKLSIAGDVHPFFFCPRNLWS